jgi:Peroxisomal membrane protein (Pex16)
MVLQPQQQHTPEYDEQQQRQLVALRRFWEAYKTWAHRHSSTVWWIDDIVSHFLFLTTSSSTSLSSSSSSKDDDPATRGWRDIVYGVLELHRFVFHTALSTEESSLFIGRTDNYGMTVEPNGSGSKTDMVAPTTTIRYLLTILPTLYPMVQQIVLWQSPKQQQQQRTTMQRYLERIRCLLRFMLLVRYWKTLPPTIPPGIMIRGGRLNDHHHSSTHHHHHPMTVEQVLTCQKRHLYVGKRSGKRWTTSPDPSFHHTTTTMMMNPKLRIQTAELLYILRPLLYTELQKSPQSFSGARGAESSPTPAWVWQMAIVLDLLSLWGLAPAASTGCGTVCHRQEWNRRRMRLWLYALRAPIWENGTQRIAERVGSSLEQTIPIVGRLLRHYFSDWLLYWKEYRLLEEG